MTDAASGTASWLALLDRKYLGTCTLLVGGVALLATNELMTANLLPTLLADLGGERLYAWVITLFLGGSVVSAAMVFWVLQRIGGRRSYLLGLATMAIASMMCALAPNMEVLVAGRALQGAAGGLLAGLGYAVIRASLPSSLWTRAAALLSVIVGLQMFVAPALGSAFLHFGTWRWAFGMTVVIATALAILVPFVLDAGSLDHGSVRPATKFPFWSVLLLGAAMLTVTLAQLPGNRIAEVGLFVATVILAGAFVMLDRRASEPLLPPNTFGSGPLKWIYLTVGLMMGALMIDAYVPLIGQRLAGLTPMKASFLSFALTLGWMVGQIRSAPLDKQRTIGRAVVAGPLLMVVGLALTAVTQGANPPVGIVVLWGLALLLVGTGCGAAYPHLLLWAMSAADDPTEGSHAGVAFNIVVQLSSALAIGVAGVVDVATGDWRDGACDLGSVRWIILVFIVLAVGAVIAAYQTTRRCL